jgi:signal transduction histidine kinase
MAAGISSAPNHLPEGGTSLTEAAKSLSPHCGVLIFNAAGEPVYSSPEALHLLGLSLPKSGIPTMRDLPVPIQDLAVQSLRTGEPLENRKIKLDAEHILRASAIPLSAAGASGVVLWFEQAETSAQLKEKLMRVDRLANLGALGAMTSHELKNALVTVKTFVELLIQKVPDAELSELVRREVGRMESLLGSISQFSGGPRGISEFDLHEVVAHACRLMQPQVRTREMVLDQELGEEPAILKGSAGQLLQAFVNLLMNAIEASAPGGRIVLKAGPSKAIDGSSHVDIIIQDTGSGIQPEHLAHLFQPFFSTKPQGTGLGLAITRRIVQEHGGTIRAESSPGKGTTFHMRLPLGGTDGPAPPAGT